MHDTETEPCPYKSLPDYAFWRRSVAAPREALLDPIVSTRFKITQQDRIATAGSCFAQHIARFLAQSGYNYLVTEKGHPLLSEESLKAYNYGTYTARYANLYTTRQLHQTLQRAYGEFVPEERVWRDGGRWIDPFRPFIQPKGFSSEAEFEADQTAHFRAIRSMVENLDVFVFTLGLTEAWHSTRDGAVFPVSPGCGAGEHSSQRHAFVNFTIDQVVADLRAAIDFIKARNPSARFLLTVSPVPLIATYEAQHVLVSTVYSKSVLRVAADTLKQEDKNVDYFPSYEIITGNFSAGRYYEDDLREVREAGVRHAMTCFFRHYLGKEIAPPNETVSRDKAPSATVARAGTTSRSNVRAAQVICDEENLDKAS
ncbi:MAG: GSCFA domain-containing protein [Pseudomonadota bacterium]